MELKKVKLKRPKNVITGNLNINSISEKFDQWKCLVPNNIDVLVLTETKLDKTFTTYSFLRDSFSSAFWLDQKQKRWQHAYVKSDIPSKLFTKHSFPNYTEG